MYTSAVLRSGRSAWKGLLGNYKDIAYDTERLLVGPFFVAFPNIREALANNTPIKTDARSCTILPNFVGYVSWSGQSCFQEGRERLTSLFAYCRIRFLVHNGKDYLPVTVTQDMVGHKLGEFSHTKKRFVYKYVCLLVLCNFVRVNANMASSGMQGTRRTSRRRSFDFVISPEYYCSSANSSTIQLFGYSI